MRNQVLQPPYCYRWAGLITIIATIVLLIVFLVRSGPTAAEQTAADPAGAAPAPPGAPVEVSAELIQRVPTADRVVALTFDDGPHPEHTRQILGLLAEYQAVATFCMVGAQVDRFPQLVRSVVDAGMRLCDHTVSHDETLAERGEPAIEWELVDTRDSLRAAAGADVPIGYFRAPGGNWSDPMRRLAARHGMRPLSWSVDSRDWKRPGAAHIVATVKHGVRPGAVILLHDGGGRREQTVQALAELLPWLVGQGYRFDFPG